MAEKSDVAGLVEQNSEMVASIMRADPVFSDAYVNLLMSNSVALTAQAAEIERLREAGAYVAERTDSIRRGARRTDARFKL
ncbi:hypothetical protein [Novosphingopyxis sp. YJ-S2-01]|uniref:hypothetical protein n=1 Tax=Novosphingopyxis sp. YJ-S2-01 TaxID=2794021 RepID=UPI0018DBEFA5|nr:hypothetical protein [Novosphingopyxis sp. YJ-S2-01]MBH9537544.1 hypothetical protein [Novosphingopyxis sp. YJ-S2-01]